MNEKKKMQPNTKANWLIFILLWVLMLGILKSVLFGFNFEFDIFTLVNQELPELFAKRLWILYLLEGLGYGLFVGASQKLALSFLGNGKHKYWIRASTLASVLVSAFTYLMVRVNLISSPFLFIQTPVFTYSIAIVLGLVQWWLLRKNFKQAWLWLLLIIPNILFESYRWQYISSQPKAMLISVLQALLALLSALVLLWIKQQSSFPEKAKNTSEAEARLTDSLPDEDEAQSLGTAYRRSEA